MDLRPQNGFTLIELLLVVVVAGLIATVAVPSLLKARDAAEAAVATGQLRSMHGNQAVYRTQNPRFANLTELNAFTGNAYGKPSGTTLRHRDFIYLMLPTPTPASLTSQFQIIGYRIRGGRIVTQMNMAEDGIIRVVIQ